ncbi:hypothetical protein GGF40_003008 [Coemansia sp. RSA 1286]|nr:hypothetical protein GGF40_003008 [Coemansia sp. RSA 1286]
MLHPESEDEGSDIYEIERIIGRRVSVLKTEYLVFWKGYNYNDCTWEPLDSNDSSCAQVIKEFENTCTKLRIAKKFKPDMGPIDFYENEGIATLISEALENMQPDTSAFSNADEDFDFTNADSEKLGVNSPTLSESHGNNNNKKTARPYHRVLAATIGWHRMQGIDNPKAVKSTVSGLIADSDAFNHRVREVHITEIKRSLKISSGKIFYLSRWSDNQLSWEGPDAFSRNINILAKYECDQFARKRTDLVKQFRQAKRKGNISTVTTTPRRSNLERMVGSNVTNSLEVLGSSSKSPFVEIDCTSISHLLEDERPGVEGSSVVSSSLFDLSTSNLLQKKSVAQPSSLSRADLFDSKYDKIGSMDIDKDNADADDDDVEVVLSGVVRPLPVQPLKNRSRIVAVNPEDHPESNASLPAKKEICFGPKPYVDIDTRASSHSKDIKLSASTLTRFKSERKQALKDIFQRNPSFGQSGRAKHVDSVSSLMDGMSLSTRGHSRRVDSFTEPKSLESYSSDAESDGPGYLPAADDVDICAESEEEGVILSSSEESSEEQVGTSSAYAANGALDHRRCDVCAKSLYGAGETFACNKCDMAYHRECYGKIVKRNEGDLLQRQGQSGVCAFCDVFGRREVMSAVTWRGARRVGKTNFADVDVLVKWRGFSYRRLSWIPLIWHLKNGGFSSNVLKHRIGASFPPPLVEDVVKPGYKEPGLIIDVTRCVASMEYARREALEASGISLDRSKWALYTDYSRVQVAWKELDLEEATWEKSPNPLDDLDEYEKWFELLRVWKQSESVSLNAHMRMRHRLRATLSAIGHFKEVSKQPAYLKGGQMYGYQLDGANWLYYQWWQGKSAILADDPGLGKTIQTIAFISIIYHLTLPKGTNPEKAVAANEGTFPFLIVVPTTLIDNWVSEFRKWAPFLSVATLSGSSKNRDVQLETTVMRNNDLKCHVLIASYETISKAPVLAKFSALKIHWEVIVYDEGHRLKNDQTKTYKALAKLRSRQRVILTGTPLQNDVRELFNVVGFVDPTARAEFQFLESSFDVNQSQTVDSVRKKLREYMLRRSKNDVELLIPPKHELILPVSMSSLQRNLYKATLTKNVRLLESISSVLHQSSRKPNGGSSDSDSALSKSLGTFQDPRSRAIGNALAGRPAAAKPKPVRIGSLQNILMEVRRIISHPYSIAGVEPEFDTKEETLRNLVSSCGKLQLLHELIPELRTRGHRILIFSQFKATLACLERYLEAEDIGYVYIDGETPQATRQQQVDRFNSPDSKMLIFLSTTRTGGLGLNLTTADVVIIYDCDFNPHADMQAMARAHRIGQRKPVLVFKLVTENSVEERIVKASTRKLALNHILIEQMGDECDSDSKKGDEERKESEIMQALKKDAVSLLSDKSSDIAAESKAIKYDHARVSKLLDQCMEALKKDEAQQKLLCQEQKNSGSVENSAAFNFARIWELDDDGNLLSVADKSPDSSVDSDSSQRDADVWSKLLKMSEDHMAASASNSSEGDGESSRLRVRKRKINYVVDMADADGRKNKSSRAREIEDGEFVDVSDRECDEEADKAGHDASCGLQTRTANGAQQADPRPNGILTAAPHHIYYNKGKVIIYSVELPIMSSIHSNSVIEGFHNFRRAQKIPSVTEQVQQQVTGYFNSLRESFKGVDLSKVENFVKPMLFFPIPTKFELAVNQVVPAQPFTGRCFICPNIHRDSFCPVIGSKSFIDAIVYLKQGFEMYWQTQQYHQFVHWYVSQIMWYVASFPERGTECEFSGRDSFINDATELLTYIRSNRLVEHARARSMQGGQGRGQQQARARPVALAAPRLVQLRPQQPTSIYDLADEAEEPVVVYRPGAFSYERFVSSVLPKLQKEFPTINIDPLRTTDVGHLRSIVAVCESKRVEFFNKACSFVRASLSKPKNCRENSEVLRNMSVMLQSYGYLAQITNDRIAVLQGNGSNLTEPGSGSSGGVATSADQPSASAQRIGNGIAENGGLAGRSNTLLSSSPSADMDIDTEVIVNAVRDAAASIPDANASLVDLIRPGLADIELIKVLLQTRSDAAGLINSCNTQLIQELSEVLSNLHNQLDETASLAVKDIDGAEAVMDQIKEAIIMNKSDSISLSPEAMVPRLSSTITTEASEVNDGWRLPPSGPAQGLLSPVSALAGSYNHPRQVSMSLSDGLSAGAPAPAMAAGPSKPPTLGSSNNGMLITPSSPSVFGNSSAMNTPVTGPMPSSSAPAQNPSSLASLTRFISMQQVHQTALWPATSLQVAQPAATNVAVPLTAPLFNGMSDARRHSASPGISMSNMGYSFGVNSYSQSNSSSSTPVIPQSILPNQSGAAVSLGQITTQEELSSALVAALESGHPQAVDLSNGLRISRGVDLSTASVVANTTQQNQQQNQQSREDQIYSAQCTAFNSMAKNINSVRLRAIHEDTEH